MSNRARFDEELRTRLWPSLRADGFRGSGRTLRRVLDDIVHVVNVQGSSTKDRFHVNLGAHFSFLPVVGERAPEAWKRITASACELKARLECEDWWEYGATPEETAARVSSLGDAFERQAPGFFDPIRELPGGLAAITPADLRAGRLAAYPGGSTPGRAALTLARTWLHLGDADRAREFVQAGIDVAPPRASSLRAELRALGAGTG